MFPGPSRSGSSRTCYFQLLKWHKSKREKKPQGVPTSGTQGAGERSQSQRHKATRLTNGNGTDEKLSRKRGILLPRSFVSTASASQNCVGLMWQHPVSQPELCRLWPRRPRRSCLACEAASKELQRPQASFKLTPGSSCSVLLCKRVRAVCCSFERLSSKRMRKCPDPLLGCRRSIAQGESRLWHSLERAERQTRVTPLSRMPSSWLQLVLFDPFLGLRPTWLRPLFGRVSASSAQNSSNRVAQKRPRGETVAM